MPFYAAMSTHISGVMLGRATRTLQAGGVIAYPTEAVYGLGCDPLNPLAVERLLAIKQRPVEKGLILIASRFDQLAPFVQPPTPEIQRRLEETWPGPVTWLLPANAMTPRWLRGQHSTLAVRVTAHPVAAALCEAFGGAIVSTSANPTGRPPARTALQSRLRCRTVDLTVHGAVDRSARPTAIHDGVSGAVLRSS
jgi:L-threonylcarbamoyladenylate synthase